MTLVFAICALKALGVSVQAFAILSVLCDTFCVVAGDDLVPLCNC